MTEISLPAARALHLAAQGLLRPPSRRATKTDLLNAIRRMGALQIDTIHVVARSPYLVLWSRLGSYKPQWLDELLAEGRIFEYWAHEACFLPIEDYPYFRHRMLNPKDMGWKFYASPKADAMAREMLAHIRAKGAVRSSDFERKDGQKGGWWQWKGEKRVLENLFTTGELMIARRHNFQRVYDLRERVFPQWNDAQLPPEPELERELAARAIKALGVAQERWVHDYYRAKKKRTPSQVPLLRDRLIEVRVKGWDRPAFVHVDHAELLEQAAAGKLKSTVTTLLSPFDPVVWDRARANVMFGFDYRLECYTPEPKRQYGYFVLPILRRGELIGRLDAKAHRAEGIFEVRKLFLEPGVKPSSALVADVMRAIQSCADWHNTPEVRITGTKPAALARQLRAHA